MEPFDVDHIDHTLVDLVLVDQGAEKLSTGRQGLTIMVDTYTLKTLGAGFDMAFDTNGGTDQNSWDDGDSNSVS